MQIEQNIPIPPVARGEYRWLWIKDMAIGDSVASSGLTFEYRVRYWCDRLGLPYKFTSRRVADNPTHNRRMWRIE